MIHPDTELKLINPRIGYGVVATKFIPAGTITWVLDKLDREFTPREYQKMETIYQDIFETYCFRNNKGNYVLCWDNGRYVNHSFRSNCLTTAYDFEIAIRDIYAGEQLTDDYGYLNIDEPFEAIDEGTARKIVYPNDLLKYYRKWDNQLMEVFDKITKRQQPLRPLISKELWQKVIRVAEGDEEMDSILKNHYFKND